MAPDALEMGRFTHLSYTGGLSPERCPFLILSVPVRSVSVTDSGHEIKPEAGAAKKRKKGNPHCFELEKKYCRGRFFTFSSAFVFYPSVQGL